ncbi:hypothetical protein [Nonomuraea typhae]|uniref:Lipoprotein n=1 Tax=Nonomuraea typhae TaxID=2603600 RepID=A0ABW7Z094_9ACTN
MSRRKKQRPWDPAWVKIVGLAVAVVSALIAWLSFVGDEEGRVTRTRDSGPTWSAPRHEPPEVTAPPIPERAKPPVTAVPFSFVGTWVGLVDDEDLDTPFPVEMRIQKGALGQTIGRVRYETFGCVGVLRLYEVSSQELSVQERIADGDHSCDEDLVFLRYKPDGTLHYSYNDGEAYGTLRKKAD